MRRMHRGRGHAVGGCNEEGREPRGHWLHVHSDLEGVIEVSDVPRPGSRGRGQVVLVRTAGSALILKAVLG